MKKLLLLLPLLLFMTGCPPKEGQQRPDGGNSPSWGIGVPPGPKY